MPENAQPFPPFGAPVFPLQGKIPYPGFKWKEEASNTPNAIKLWDDIFPQSNWGARTGSESGLTVVDCDGDEAAQALLKVMGAARLSEVSESVVKTPRGWHLYFQYCPELRQTVGLLPKVDVRNDGGYVVVPPSQGYAWVSEAQMLPVVPEKLLALQAVPRPSQTPPERLSQPRDEVLIGEGGRNDYLMRIAASMRRYGTPQGAIEEALEALNESALEDPLPLAEVRGVARSVATRYGSADELLEDPPSTPVRAGEFAQQMVTYLDDKEVVYGEPTGFMALDELLGGGKRLGEITAWHAEAKTGKNTFWHFLMHKWLVRGVPMGYASRELSPATEVLPNILSLFTKADVWQNETQPERYKEILASWPMYFASGYGYMPIEEVVEWVKALRTQGVRYFWIDHLHYCLADAENHADASKFIKQLKVLAKRYDVHFDVIIQPTKIMDGQRLSKNTIKGGSAMGQTIDNLIIMQRHQNSPNAKNCAELSLVDTRSKASKLGSFVVQYDPVTYDFREVDLVKDETEY